MMSNNTNLDWLFGLLHKLEGRADLLERSSPSLHRTAVDVELQQRRTRDQEQLRVVGVLKLSATTQCCCKFGLQSRGHPRLCEQNLALRKKESSVIA